MNELILTLRQILPETAVRENEPMNQHCSFRTGGPADLFVRVSTTEELTEVLAAVRKADVPFFLLGRGSNILVSDAGYRGVVITMLPEAGSDSETAAINTDPADPSKLIAGAGVTLACLAAAARDRSLTGLEFAAGIPGTVGGALVMNAGAYGGEMKDVVETADLLMPDGTLRTFTAEEMEFGYRTSVLKRNHAAAIRTVLKLQPGDPAAISALMEDLGRRRREKQPLEYPSAGSTFKRPEGHFAGKLIEDAGLRGFRIGGAGVSEKHCGFVVNYGGASSAEIRNVITAVQEKVAGDTGIVLEPEVIFLGEFPENGKELWRS